MSASSSRVLLLLLRGLWLLLLLVLWLLMMSVSSAAVMMGLKGKTTCSKSSSRLRKNSGANSCVPLWFVRGDQWASPLLSSSVLGAYGYW
ncbi:hypothetical protein Micbo1qcDRAFT_164601 [Microdochium bolleyi]|uniref:Uncharacterized protein n=1 Tax=Microdochium bolleyi TaxID=196109 RepID=A0A136IYW7_9PEZI|nr:hypothetical protein Micbo1qcDRAFT_164601 [Microdochium bolleyi]